jgi:hypothetical protein
MRNMGSAGVQEKMVEKTRQYTAKKNETERAHPAQVQQRKASETNGPGETKRVRYPIREAAVRAAPNAHQSSDSSALVANVQMRQTRTLLLGGGAKVSRDF